MRTRLTVPGLILAAIALTAACGSGNESGGPASPTTRDLSKVPTAGTPRTPTTTAPTTKIADTPECTIYAQFSYAQTAMSFATADQAAPAIATYETVADKTAELLPQFADQIATIKRLTVLDTTGQLSDDETAELRAAFEPITEWNKSTCIIEPG